MQTSAFSQTFYPKKIIWGNDTILGISKDQMVKLNRSLNDYVHLLRVNDLLRKEIITLDSTIFTLKKVGELERRSYVMAEKKSYEQAEISRELKNALRREKKRKIITSVCVGAGGVLTGALVGMLITK